MLTTNDEKLTEKLVHAIRGQLTLYNFSANNNEREQIVDGVTRMVERVSMYTRLHDEALSVESVNMHNLLADVVEELADVRVQFESENVRTSINPELISALAYELIGNALLYSDDDVQVSIHNTGAHVVLRVEDSGPGLPSYAADHIAEPFVASDHANSGVGLGLALAWAIVQAHDAAMTVHTDPSSGTTVLVTLDLV